MNTVRRKFHLLSKVAGRRLNRSVCRWVNIRWPDVTRYHLFYCHTLCINPTAAGNHSVHKKFLSVCDRDLGSLPDITDSKQSRLQLQSRSNYKLKLFYCYMYNARTWCGLPWLIRSAKGWTNINVITQTASSCVSDFHCISAVCRSLIEKIIPFFCGLKSISFFLTGYQKRFWAIFLYYQSFQIWHHDTPAVHLVVNVMCIVFMVMY